MQTKKFFVLFLFIALFTVTSIVNAQISTEKNVEIGTKGQHEISPDNPKIEYIGRVDKTDPLKPRFGFSGVSIHCKFSGELIKIKFSSTTSKNYYFYIIDEEKPQKINIKTPSSEYTLSQNLKDTIHEFRMIRLTEGSQGMDTFEGLILGNNDSLVQLPQLKKRMFEFYGNSITCGFGNETNDPHDGFNPEQENFYYTYASYVSRLFNAECVGISKSGIGMYRNHQGPASGSSDNMLTIYDHILYQDNNLIWDFTEYIPDIVCIHLGTNDARKQDRFISKIFEDSCEVLVQTLRHYYPEAYIIFLTGPTQKGEKLKSVQDAVNSVINKLNDPKFSLFNMSTQTGEFGIGGTWHPTVAQHWQNARELENYIECLTNWKPAPYLTSSSVSREGRHINLKFSEPFMTETGVSGFYISGNNEPIPYSSALVTEENDSIVTVNLEERIMEGQKISIDYHYGNLKSIHKIELQPFFDKEVKNNVIETVLNAAKINSNGDKLILSFNKPLIKLSSNSISVLINDFLVDDFTAIEIDPANHSKISILLHNEITSYDTVKVNIPKGTVCGNDSIYNELVTEYIVNNHSVITTDIPSIEIDPLWHKSKNIVIYPNPANDFITVVLDDAEKKRIRFIKIFNSEGEEIRTVHHYDSDILNIGDLETGLYHLWLICHDNHRSFMFVKH